MASSLRPACPLGRAGCKLDPLRHGPDRSPAGSPWLCAVAPGRTACGTLHAAAEPNCSVPTAYKPSITMRIWTRSRFPIWAPLTRQLRSCTSDCCSSPCAWTWGRGLQSLAVHYSRTHTPCIAVCTTAASQRHTTQPARPAHHVHRLGVVACTALLSGLQYGRIQTKAAQPASSPCAWTRGSGLHSLAFAAHSHTSKHQPAHHVHGLGVVAEEVGDAPVLLR